jgi:8-oxo-dGTP diphosphatase
LLVALVIPKHRHVWCLPKGTVELGETYPAAALREVREETGLEAEILQSLDSIQYTFLSPRRIRVNKTVHYYLMRRVGGDVSLHDHEMAEVHLVPLQEAVRMLEYPNERSVLERALAVVDAAG